MLVVYAIGLGITGEDVINGDSDPGNTYWCAGLVAGGIIAALTAGLRVLGLDVGRLVIGADRRLSTSKLQALMWTYALLFVLLTIVLAKFFGTDAAYIALIGVEGTDTMKDHLPDEYLLLLGGPFAAAVAAKGITSSKVESGALTKTPGPESATPTDRAGEAFSNDHGDADLIDTQYLLFNFLALTYFIGGFVTNPDAGLPQIPDVLVGLTSLSAAAYVSNKAIARDTPVLTGLVPERGKVGQEVTVFGRYLLLPAGGEEADRFLPVYILFGGVKATHLSLADDGKGNLEKVGADPEKIAVSRLSGGDQFVVQVPPGAPAGLAKVVARNNKGVASEPLDFMVVK